MEEGLKREKEEKYPLNQSLEILQSNYGRVHHYGPSRIAMFQVRQMQRYAANKQNEVYDKDVLFAYFRPEFQSPDYYEMLKFITDRRRGVTAPQPNP